MAVEPRLTRLQQEKIPDVGKFLNRCDEQGSTVVAEELGVDRSTVTKWYKALSGTPLSRKDSRTTWMDDSFEWERKSRQKPRPEPRHVSEAPRGYIW